MGQKSLALLSVDLEETEKDFENVINHFFRRQGRCNFKFKTIESAFLATNFCSKTENKNVL